MDFPNDFDRRAGLHSAPARWGVAGALRLAAACHLATIGCLAALPLVLLPDPAGVVRWLLVVVVVSAVACSWPAWQAMRLPAARALAYE